MSLINRMLQDLDERRASALERAAVAPQVRALPPPRRFPWGRVLSVAAGMALGAGGLWFALDTRDAPARTALAAAVAEPPAVALPPLVVQMPPEGGPVAAPGPTGDTAPAPADAAGLQLAFSLRAPPAPPAEPSRRDPAPVVHPAEAPAAAGEIELRPRQSDGAENEYRKAMAAVRQGLAADAAAGFQAALRIDPRHLSARQALLSLLVGQRRWAEAQSLLAEGLALDPAQPGWIMALARLQVEQGQTAEADATLARHAVHGEGNADYQAFRGLLLHKLHRPHEAAERYAAALVLRPGEGRWWYGLGLALEADQRPAEARDAFRQARSASNLPPELAAAAAQHVR